MKFFFGAVGGIWIPLALVWCSQASEALSQKSRFLAQDQLVGLLKIFYQPRSGMVMQNCGSKKRR